MEPSMSALDTAPSFFLQQHKDNLVQWRPWSPDVLAEAEATGKPISVSIGYSGCNLCHAMSRESFSDPETAAFLNENYIPVLVDREQRPDVDQLYQAAALLMGDVGGWPLSLFLDHKGRPFLFRGYLPKDERPNEPAFGRILKEMVELYRSKPEEFAKNTETAFQQLTTFLDRDMYGQPEALQLDMASMSFGQRYDIFLGGLAGPLKKTQPLTLEVLWRAYLRSGIPQFLQLVTTTLDAALLGGLYDHIGGGFFRYTADERWLVPHIEKMLADNAGTVEFLTSMWQFNRNPLCRARVEETIGWMLRELKMGQGFAAGMAAEYHGEEGKFYFWTEAEVDAALSGTFVQRFKQAYGVTRDGNLSEGRNILRRLGHPQPVLTEADDALLAKQRAILLEVRDKRKCPSRDDLLMADWNAAAISALTLAGAAFDRADWLRAAIATFDEIVAALGDGDRLYHSSYKGARGAKGFADDYAMMARAALHLWEATGEARFLDAAKRWTATLNDHFWNTAKGGYCATADDAEALIVRGRVLYDQSTPSANSAMLIVLMRLGMITGEGAYGQRYLELLAAFADEFNRAWIASPSYVNSFESIATAFQLVVVGPRNNPRTQELIRAAWGKVLPNRLLYVVESGDALPSHHPAFGKGTVNGAPAAYLCQRDICSPPITSAVALSQALTLPPRIAGNA
jgi:uncharacterized protein